MLVTCELGAYVETGGSIASIAGVAPDDDHLDQRILSAMSLDQARRVEVDVGYSIDQLADIAWMTETTSQSPSTSRAAIHQMRDLLGRWAVSEEQVMDSPPNSTGPLPVVYRDGAIERVLRNLGTLLEASSRSGQSDTAAIIVTSFAHALPRLRSAREFEVLTTALAASLPSVAAQAAAPALMESLDGLVEALTTAGRGTRRVEQVQDHLRTSTHRRLDTPVLPHDGP